MTDKPKRKNAEPTPRRYWWIFGTLTVFLFAYPIRILTYWWINPILYFVLTIGLLIATLGLLHRYGWQRPLFVLVAICIYLSAAHIQLSIRQIGSCYIDDYRYSKYFACSLHDEDYFNWKFLGGYQQIASSPIGMSGYCWYEANKPLSCLAFRLRLWSPFLLIAGAIHFYIGYRRRKAEMLTSV
jgi:hypothetical protein